MPPKMKGQKMDLEDFLGDWTEEDTHKPLNTGSTDLFAAVGMATPANQEVTLPNAPPYTARISNLSYEATEEDVRHFFKSQNIQQIRMPKSPENKSKGYAFVEFADRDSLASALRLEGGNMSGRSVRVGLEQRSNDGYGHRYNDEPELNWGSRKAPQFTPREPRGPPRGMGGGFDEPNLDWANRRAPTQAPRQPREPRGPPRGMGGGFDEPDLDWGNRRAPTQPPRASYARNDRPREPREPREPEPELNWGSRRAPQKAPSAHRGGNKSGKFDVLKGAQEEDAPAPAAKAPEAKAAAPKLADSIAAATATSEQDSTWTTVAKKH